MSKPFHLNDEHLYCNRCQKYIDKFSDTILIDNEIHCLYCENWLCGFNDCFGVQCSPSIERIKQRCD
jgi:hypothetical protein